MQPRESPLQFSFSLILLKKVLWILLTTLKILVCYFNCYIPVVELYTNKIKISLWLLNGKMLDGFCCWCYVFSLSGKFFSVFIIMHSYTIYIVLRLFDLFVELLAAFRTKRFSFFSRVLYKTTFFLCKKKWNYFVISEKSIYLYENQIKMLLFASTR